MVCELCGKEFGLFRRASDIYWEVPGGGKPICKKCAKSRMEEINEHNEQLKGNPNKKKDTKCKHEWVHPSLNVWHCTKCGAHLSWLCGCGGSEYVCQKHYDKLIKENQPIEKYLAKHSW